MNKFSMLIAALSLAACGKAQQPSNPLHTVAIKTCKAVIEGRAINKNTVAYRAVDVTPVAGGLKVAINFSAKNEIGSASFMRASCVTSPDGKTMTNIAVTTL